MPENNVKQDLVRDINPTRLTALEKVAMPQDPEAEMSVLSAMMYDEDARSECIVRLTEEDFYTPSNRYIFKAIKTLFERNSACLLYTSSYLIADLYRFFGHEKTIQVI